MRPPTAGAKAAAASSGAKGGSQIPLPLRRSSGKSDKAQEGDNGCGEDNELSKDRSRSSREGDRRHGNPEKSSGGGKMSLLSGTSFCCASGQKEEIRDSQAMRPQQNRRAKNAASVKRDSEMNGPEPPNSTPPHQALLKKIVTPRSRKVKPEKDTVDDHYTKDGELHGCKPRVFTKEEKAPSRSVSNSHPTHPNNKLKLPEISDKRRVSSGQSTKGMEDGCSPDPLRKDRGNDPETTVPGKQKCTDMLRKLRKDPAPCSTNNILVLNVDNKLYEKGLGNRGKDGDTPSGERVAEKILSGGNDNKLHCPVTEEGSPALVPESTCSVDMETSDTSLKSPDMDELDCPCCDSEPKDVATREIVDSLHDAFRVEVSPPPVAVLSVSEDWLHDRRSSGLEREKKKEEKGELEYQVTALKEELERERLKLQSQQGHVSQLEKEMEMMEQLKQELSREQELRKEAEEKLREILDRGRHLEQGQRSPDGNTHVSVSVNTDHSLEPVDADVCNSDESNSPLLLGYESRIRRYQSYIGKLEKDNLMLIEELKRFKDLSPCSQQDQAKSLLVKLGQLERDSQQQQVQYECCLDEVANKLVHTLLNQKHLEQECEALQLRVQQLEMENLVLLEATGQSNETKNGDPENGGKSSEILSTVHKARCGVSFESSSDNSSAVSETLFPERSTSKSDSHSKLMPPVFNANLQKKLCAERFLKYSGVSQTRTCKVHPIRQDECEISSNKSKLINSELPIASNAPSCSKPTSFSLLNSQVDPPSRLLDAVENDAMSNPHFKSQTFELEHTCIRSNQSNFPAKTIRACPDMGQPYVNYSNVNSKPSFSLDNTKIPSSKRKRFTKVGTSSDRIAKEFRLKKSQHVQWDNLVKEPANTAFEKNRLFPMRPPNYCDTDSLSVETPLNSNDVWNVSCTSTRSHKDSMLHDSMSFLCSSTKRLHEPCAESSRDKTYSLTDADTSVSNDGMHRTRDEGYSTMSSDLQPDSAADTTVSEQDEHSVTYIVSEGGLRCSDDSVTECLDGSMSSSSDSGFGPLHYMTRNPARRRLANATVDDEDSCDSHKESDCSPSNDHILLDSLAPLRQVMDNQHIDLDAELSRHSTEKYEVPMTITFPKNYDPLNSSLSKVYPLHVCQNTSCRDLHCRNKPHPPSNDKQNFTDSSNHTKQPLTIANPDNIIYKVQLSKSTNVGQFESVKNSSQGNQQSSRRHVVPKDAWTRTEGDDLSLYFPDSLDRSHCSQEENMVETAEKATLTEPEEGVWREKALAHFIDESIWSLYSSESDTQLRQFSETFLSKNSTGELSSDRCLIPRSETNPCIMLSGALGSEPSNVCNVNDDGANSGDDSSHLHILKDIVRVEESKAYFSPHGLERVASDTVLYVKDAFRELETSMKPGLKSAKNITNQNIPLFDHLSSSCLNNDPISFPSPVSDGNQQEKYGFQLSVPKSEQFSKSNSLWPKTANHSHSSSVSSFQSSVSCHLISDELDDEEVQPVSRKGSQDPDLSSDADTENLEHQDFVERWLQKEIAESKRSENKISKSKWQKSSTSKIVTTSGPECRYPKTTEELESSTPYSSNPSDVPPKSSEIETPLSQRQPSGCEQTLPEVIHRLPMTPDSPESCCMGAVSAVYIDACASYTQGKSSTQFTPSPEHPSSLSSIVYPLLFTCDNLDDETVSLCDKPDSNEVVQTVELEECLCKSLEPEVKEFNSDFYRLCSMGSLRSLESFVLPGQEIFLKKYAGSPKFMRADSRYPVEEVQKLSLGSLKTESNSEFNLKPPGCSQPVRPASFASPLLCNRKQFSCFGKDLQTTRSSGRIAQNVFSSVTNKDTNLQYHCEQKSKCSPRFDDSLPLNRTYVLKRQVSETEVKAHNKKALVATVKPCSYGGENIPTYIPDRSCSESPGSRGRKDFGTTENSSIGQVFSHGILSSPRNDAVSKRRRERISVKQNRLKEGRGTSWVHLQTSDDIADPQTRANLWDSVVATTSSSGSSSSTDEDEEVLVVHNNSQLQRICREKRQKVKACGKDDFLALSPRIRTSIVNRQGMYYRYGDQEKEAIACFDFLEELPTSNGERGSVELFQKRMICDPALQQCNCESASKGQITAASRVANHSSPSRSCQFSSFNSQLRLPGLWNKPLSHNMSSSTINSQDYELLDHISLSDSCAESYSSTPDSFEEAS